MDSLMEGTIAFLNPEWHARIVKQRRAEREAYYKSQVKQGNVVQWDEQKTKFEKRMVIDGDTFTPELTFPDLPVSDGQDLMDQTHWRFSRNRKWAYANREWPAGVALETAQGPHRRGFCWFTKPMVSPTLLYACKPWQSRSGSDEWEFMMSYTPMEVFTLRAGVRAAKGKVLLGGLGLGIFLRMVAAKKSVTEIVVVEKCQEQLNFIGKKVVARERKRSGKPITLICGDVYDHVGKHGSDTRHLLDIWPSFNNYPGQRYSELVRAGHHMWGWGIFKD